MFEILPISKSLWRNKTAAILIISQLAITIAIMSNALFFIYQRQVKIDRPTGIVTNQLIAMTSTKSDPQGNFELTAKGDIEFIRSRPNVINASLLSSIPLNGGGRAQGFSRKPGVDEPAEFGNVISMTEHGMNTLGMELIAGRNFSVNDIIYTEDDNYLVGNIPVIVSKKIAEVLFPNESSLGKTIYEDGARPNTIVGVVEEMMGSWPRGFPGDLTGQVVFYPMMYMSTNTNYLIRTEEGQRGAVMLDVVESLREKNSARMITGEETLENILRITYQEDYAMMKILMMVVILLVLVNSLGIVGLTTFWVNQRRKQIGIRRALGATKIAIIRYFIVENAILCFCSAVLGGGMALVASDYMVRAFSLALLPWQFVLVTVFTILILTMLAAATPACRAARISPAEATA